MKKNRITNRNKRYQVVTFLLKCIGMTPFLLFAFTVSAEIQGVMPGGEPSLTCKDSCLIRFFVKPKLGEASWQSLMNIATVDDNNVTQSKDSSACSVVLIPLFHFSY